MSKKIFNLYGMNMFLSGLPYYFVGILLLKHLGFSFTEIATLSVITELCGSVFDIPLSYISSKIGYKKILAISNLLLILALWGQRIIYISCHKYNIYFSDIFWIVRIIIFRSSYFL